ncbi:acylneuraminate cytidylyltransferase family protein, partial [Candidatus Pelagibacter bacterium]|nr:acylneuraminate cytidylyltransferase family protein [Candidatus Pelagibacter bacterium]
MKNLIIIPARKGSKRLKNKNFLKLNGITLLEHTIEFAKTVNSPDLIIVSTDSRELQKLSKSYNVLCPWLRPKNISNDKSTSAEVAIHALKWFEKNSKQLIDNVI